MSEFWLKPAPGSMHDDAAVPLSELPKLIEA